MSDRKKDNMSVSGSKKRIDLLISIVPMTSVLILCFFFFSFPDRSNRILEKVRFFLGNSLGSYYLIIGLVFFFLSIYMAFSKYGSIVLGDKGDKPAHSFLSWGAMMFTCGLAADILFYSFSEWILYANDPYIKGKANIADLCGVYPLFHWSFIPWSFYLVLAVAFAYMLHVKKIKRQRFSEACRPLLGKSTDGRGGRIIDMLAVFALIAGTATTFSIATPLMSTIIKELFRTDISNDILTPAILILTCFIYSYSLLHGIKGIDLLAKACIFLFFSLMAYVLFFGGSCKYIIESGIGQMGRLLQNFLPMSTYTDPLRENSFPQNWTIYYWSYWIVWCVAAPFFIGAISKGRTVRQTILGGYIFGAGSTLLSFIVFGNYSMKMQFTGLADFSGQYAKGLDLYNIIISIIRNLPMSSVFMFFLFITMMAFYATSFDAIALTASCYSYRLLDEGEKPHPLIQLAWCILLILLPLALVFAKSSMSNLQSVSIIAAFPLGFVMLVIALAFLKDARSSPDK